jgi:alkylresorcinol/alkylpyrone synthase
MLLSVELCSLTLQREDLSIANLIASGLFGDGAACAVVAGAEVPGKGPKIVATTSAFYPNSERVMGWDISERGFKVVLSPQVPEMVRRYLRSDVDRFLGQLGLKRPEIQLWLAHPGGPRVLEAMEEALELPRAALERSWRTLREVGNLSSTSVLLVLEEVLAEPPAPGTLGLLLALGPGFCSELVLLEWD